MPRETPAQTPAPATPAAPHPSGFSASGQGFSRSRLDSSTGSLVGQEDFSQDDADEAAYAEHDDDHSIATRPPSRLSSRLSSTAAAEIDGISIEALMQHPFVKDLISRLAARDQSFERLSQDVISKHPYVRSLLTHIADLSQKLLAVTSSDVPPTQARRAPEEPSTPSSSHTTGSGPADTRAQPSNTQADIHLRRFYYRYSAKTHYGVKSMAAIPIKDCIFTIDTGRVISKERFQTMKETAQLEVKGMHKLPAVASPYKNKTLGYYNKFAKPLVKASVKTMLKEFPELASKGDWKARGVIDYCLRLHRKPNPLYTPRPSSKGLPDGVEDEDDDEDDDEEDDEEDAGEANFSISSQPQRSTVPNSTSRTSADPNPSPPTAAQMASAATASPASASSTPTTATQGGTSVPSAHQPAAREDSYGSLGLSEAAPDYSALAAVLGRPVALLNSASQHAPSTSTSESAQVAAAQPSQQATNGADISGQVPNNSCTQINALVDADTINLDVGRFLCQSRDPEFNMKSKRVTLKRKLRSFEAQQPFSQDDIDSAQGKADSLAATTSSPQKGRRRAGLSASPTKGQHNGS
ncbi:hypothetical protein OC844_006323, partial [Tilletia horrida]